jgi:hypothetical protein
MSIGNYNVKLKINFDILRIVMACLKFVLTILGYKKNNIQL